MKYINLLFVMILVVLAFGACASRVDPDRPPEIVYGEDVCARCGMIISDERFAASLVVEKSPNVYEHLLFDDIGNMLMYAREAGEDAHFVSYFVHDYHSKEWLNAQDAHFVLSDEIQTPMAFGIAAFEEYSVAEAEAQKWHGSIADFATVSQQIVDPMRGEHTHKH
jgi:copper chaperone NosL